MCHISSVSGFKVHLATLFLSTAGLQGGHQLQLFYCFCILFFKFGLFLLESINLSWDVIFHK